MFHKESKQGSFPIIWKLEFQKSQLSYIYNRKGQKEEKMGQQLFTTLKQQIHDHTPAKYPSSSPQILLTSILQQAEDLAGHPLTSQEIHQHLLNYLESQSQSQEETRKRRRSYQLMHQQETHMEEPSSTHEELGPESKLLEEKMKWLEDIEDEVRTNITELMVIQKPFKIRQNFRRLILQLLKIDNLWVYILHSEEKIQYHDFQNNYIEDQKDEELHQRLISVISEGGASGRNDDIMRLFKIPETEDSSQFVWNICKESKQSFVYLIKKLQYDVPCRFDSKIIAKIAKMAMISTSEEEISIIQSYSKDFLEILELLVKECEVEVCQNLETKSKFLQQVEKEMMNKEEKDTSLIARVRAFQQLQFQLLERLRMYKKYVCEDDKIFLQFDQKAELSFLSNNYNHPLLKKLPLLWQRKKLFLQKIFEDYKPINDFIKKAVNKKVKSNKLYQLNFETKIRVLYDHEGRILRMHVIFEELEDSSSNSSQIYNSSSTKILSEDSGKGSFNDLEGQGEDKERRQSALVRNLEKNNPGIINQGWINLFIKDQHLNPRQNTYFKNKPGKGYTIKRSISLNHNLDSVTQSNETKDNLQHINIESIDLNLLELDEDLLEPFVIKVFKKLDFFQSGHFNQEYFLNFLGDVHSGYQTHNNPFHNFTHGVNVMHTCYILANSTKNRQPLSPFKIFTIVFSGLCHDVGHTGFTNLFQIASGSKKAITYNDSSPLQNFHAATSFQLLRKPENNFLKDLSPEETKDFRKSVISSILYTDIKEHFPLIKKFKAILNNELPFNDQYLSLLSGMIVHTADFGGSAKEFQICKAWSLKVNLEFSNQYKREGELGLPQTPFLKDLNNISVLSKNEGGFLKVIVFPLYECMDEFCVNDPRVQKLREYAETNIAKWEKIHQESSEKQKQESKKK